MKPRADFTEDFGLSGLTKYLQSRLAPRDAAGILSFVDNLLEVEGRAYAQEVAEDVRRMTRSSLPDAVLSTVWLAATESRFDPAGTGLGIRIWLEQIADTCSSFVRRDDPSFNLGEPGPADHPELREEVLAELRGTGPALAEKAVTAIYPPPLRAVVPALEAAVTELGPDLGFRLFLRAMKVYFIPIGPARLSRFEEIGRRLGYHEWVVEDGSLNVWSDLED
ncbi:hypothetical protein AB0A71_41505 [Kitasatospora aureofaciens]|uniref:hypothetical protein n=1 Tax=Kitasatospora aureofaciens TaxID=1894 RepID=UPI0033E8A8C8